jgi:hypothetical protein
MPDVEIWVWNLKNCLDGTLASVLAAANAHGVGLVVKADDGGNPYPQLDGSTPVDAATIVQRGRDAGVPISLWGYVYMDPQPVTVNGYRRQGYLAELAIAQRMVTQAKPVRYYADNEAESEGRACEGMVYAQALAATAKSAGVTVLSSCLPLPRYHPQGLYYQFGQAGFLMAPQMYWPYWRGQYDFGDPATLVKDWLADAQQYGIPVQTYCPTICDAPKAGVAPTDAELVAWLAAIDRTTCPVVSVWALDSFDDGAWARLARLTEWARLDDRRYRAGLLLEQAKGLYQQGNQLVAQAIQLLEQHTS